MSEAQRLRLLDTVRSTFGPDVEVRLFGSRVDDSKRGGDYDIFLETTLADAKDLVERRLRCLAMLHASPEFEGEKFDLVVASLVPEGRLSIHDVARKEGILL